LVRVYRVIPLLSARIVPSLSSCLVDTTAVPVALLAAEAPVVVGAGLEDDDEPQAAATSATGAIVTPRTPSRRMVVSLR
jgi:hypothetical protein